jgi:anti-sigma regulatory factor (Ser/Thr protein kinase)
VRTGQTPCIEHRLPHDVASVGSARRLVGDFAGARLSGRRLDELILISSEVVANAVTHGSAEPDGGIGLRLEEDQEAVRIVVTEDGEGFAMNLDNLEDANRDEHFGLLLVDRFADRWGSPFDCKTAIWVEVDVPTSE